MFRSIPKLSLNGNLYRVSYRIFGLKGGGGGLSCNEISQNLTDPLWENKPNCLLLQNEMIAHKVNAVIIAVGDQKMFF